MPNEIGNILIQIHSAKSLIRRHFQLSSVLDIRMPLYINIAMYQIFDISFDIPTSIYTGQSKASWSDWKANLTGGFLMSNLTPTWHGSIWHSPAQSDSLAVVCLVNVKCGYTFCSEPWPFCIGSPDWLCCQIARLTVLPDWPDWGRRQID